MYIVDYVKDHVPFKHKGAFVRSFLKWQQVQGISDKEEDYDKEDLDILLNKVKLGRW